MRTFLLMAVLALSAPAFAQTAKKPAAGAAAATETPEEQPALEAPVRKPVKPAEAGMTIVGEDESPIGLYITPWRDAAPEKGIDRPARLLQEEMLPIDEDVFVRQVEYYDALTGAARKKAATP